MHINTSLLYMFMFLTYNVHVHTVYTFFCETYMYMYVHMYICYIVYIHCIHRFKDAWSYAQALESAGCWNELAEAALYHLEIQLGTSCTYIYIYVHFNQKTSNK